jgi:glycosyltransferase involved in cell wall biosynthesis
MSQLSRKIPEMWVTTDLDFAVDKSNPRCFQSPAFGFPMSQAAVNQVKRLSRRFDFFHAELGYATTCLMAGVPYGVYVLGTAEYDALFSSKPLKVIFRRSFKEALSSANYVLATPGTLERRAALSIRQDVGYIGTPVDDSKFEPSLRRKWPESSAEKITLLSPHRIQTLKGHDLIWKAIETMKNRGRVDVLQPKWGFGDFYKEMLQTAPPEVRFVPVVAQDRMPEMYAKADIVLGQMNEQGVYGTTEIEAALIGLPVTTFVPAVATHGPSPFLPSVRSAVELARVLDKLIEDLAFREEYSTRCRSYALFVHGTSEVKERYIALWNSSDAQAKKSTFRTNLMRYPSQSAILASGLLGKGTLLKAFASVYQPYMNA